MKRIINFLFTKEPNEENLFQALEEHKNQLKAIEVSIDKLQRDRYNQNQELHKRIKKAEEIISKYKKEHNIK